MNLIAKRRIRRITFATLKTSVVVCFIIFVVLPFLFKFSLRLQRGMLFLTFIAHPSNAVLKAPGALGLYATRNFYVTHRDEIEEQDVTIGVWHILPNFIAKRFSKQLNLTEDEMKLLTETESKYVDEQALDNMEKQLNSEYSEITADNEQQFFEQMLQLKGSRIVFYFHGNSGSRAASHRIELYKVLRNMGYHVIAFDYRSYGDSSTTPPSELGLVIDAIAVYKYITSITENPVVAWGHSLGTGVSTHTLAALERQNILGPKLLILESPFNNIREEISEHPFARLFRKLPWFNYTIVNPMFDNNLRFESDKHICSFPQPVTILHAEDDLVVPYKLGYKLYRTALDNRQKTYGPIQFHRFSASSGYGHKFICRAPELPELVEKFLDTYF